MINILENPQSETYKLLKNNILNHTFPWYYSDYDVKTPLERVQQYGVDKLKNHTQIPFYSHCILDRPESKKYSSVESHLLEESIVAINEIIKYNLGDKKYFHLRICANCTHPSTGIQFSMPHHDHEFDHLNFICYLNNTGGKTFIEGEDPYDPSEDQCILFSGEHYMELPKKERRVVLVSTIFPCS
tara:strand:+ start:114 stop:671 length:558 start_codon:yes stop_codon:yes gene_type:complete